VNNNLISEVAQLTRRNQRLTCTHLSDILGTSDDLVVNLMPRRMQKLCDKEGERIGY
jgi:hypothetical protein